MRIYVTVFLLLCCFRQIALCQQNEESIAANNLQWEAIASFAQDELPLHQLHGAFCGAHNGAIIIAGGHEKIAADSLQNIDFRWNDKIYILAQNETGVYEKKETNIDLPFGPYSVTTSVQTNFGLVCFGGSPALKDSLEVFILKWDVETGTLTYEVLPSVIKPERVPAAAIFGTKVILGGSFNQKYELFSFDLTNLDSGQKWQGLTHLDDLDGSSPVITNQNNGIDNCLFLFSGDESYRFNSKTTSWKKLSGVPFEGSSTDTMLINAAFPLGATDILCLNQAAGKSYLYHAITDNWENTGSFPEGVNPYFFVKNFDAVLALSIGGDSEVTLHKLYFEHKRQAFGFLNVLVLVLYFGLLILFGFYFSKKQKNTDDYFKGNKKIPWWAAGLSLYGTGLSAISYMAVPAKTYATDWAYFMTKLPQLLIPIIVCWLFIPFYRKLDVTSAYEYLEKRFNLATRLIGSMSFIVFQLGRIGIVLYLPAIALNVASGFDIVFCIALMGVISLIYTIMGGIEAVTWTDVFQVVILIGGIILCLVLISLDFEGGTREIIDIGQQNEKFEILNMALDFTQPTFWVVVLSGFFSELIMYSTDQSMVQRYLTTKDIAGAKRSIWVSTLLGLCIGWIFFYIGTALFAYYKANPSELLPAMQSTDAIFPWYIFSHLPDGVNGLLIAGIFAAAMSSLSGSMNSAATAYTVDFHQRFNWKGDALFVGRLSTLIIGSAGISFALLFATMDVKSLWDEFFKIIGLITGGLGGVFLLGIISTRANGIGALAGLIGSGVVQFLVAKYQPVHFLIFTATGFISCLVIGYVVSLFFQKHSKSLAGLTIFTK